MQEFALAVTQGSCQSHSVVIKHCRRASRRREDELWHSVQSNMNLRQWEDLVTKVEEPGWGGDVAI